SSTPNNLGWMFFYFTLMFKDRVQCSQNPSCQGLWHTSLMYLNKFSPDNPGARGREEVGAAFPFVPPIGMIDAILAPGAHLVHPCNGSKTFYGMNTGLMD